MVPPGSAVESSRLAALDPDAILDFPLERALEELVQLASTICLMPIAQISLTDPASLPATIGAHALSNTSSFSEHALGSEEIFVVEDADADSRFAADPWVVGEPFIRSYAGAPLVTPAGHRLGILSVLDTKPHCLQEGQRTALVMLARQALAQMELKREIARLRRSEVRTQSILDQARGALITVTGDGMIASVNAEAECLFGYESHELVGRMLETLLGRFDAGSALGRVIECDAVRRDGRHFPCELSLFEVAGWDAGRGFAAHILDVSERHVLERMKHDFVSTVSHELRTPLTSIHGSLGLLASGVMGEFPREAKAMVSVAQRNSVRLLALVNDILDFDNLESGQIAMHMDSAPLMPIIERAAGMIRPLAAQDGVRIELKGAPLQVRGDEARLGQVVANFLSNAVKYSPPGSTVTVTVASLGEMLEVRVQDRGRGISPELQEKLFQRFQRADSSDARTRPGAGLGLAICKAIVDQHGGTIGVVSREGKGSTFWFRIPRVVEERDVLLIEEDAVLLDAMATQLIAGGNTVRTACSGWSGLAAVGERSPSLIVLDVDLRDLDGFGVVAELRNDPLHRSLPLVVFSDNDLSAMDRYRLRLGPTRFLTRSCSTDTQLRVTVDQLLDDRSVGADV